MKCPLDKEQFIEALIRDALIKDAPVRDAMIKDAPVRDAMVRKNRSAGGLSHPPRH